MTKIIGVCGLIGSGKDTVAQYLIDSRLYTRLSFADSLKDACSEIFGWDREMLEGKTEVSRAQREMIDPYWANKLGIPDFSPRKALQLVGTNLFRDVLHQDIWVCSAERKILNLIKAYGTPDVVRVVFSDCRFPNEIDMIRNRGGEIWHVHRGTQPEWWETAIDDCLDAQVGLPMWRMEKHYPGVHYSEWAWVATRFDRVFDNNSSLDVLYKSVEEACKDIDHG